MSTRGLLVFVTVMGACSSPNSTETHSSSGKADGESCDFNMQNCANGGEQCVPTDSSQSEFACTSAFVECAATRDSGCSDPALVCVVNNSGRGYCVPSATANDPLGSHVGDPCGSLNPINQSCIAPLQCVIVADSGTCQQPSPLGSNVGDPCGPRNPVNQTCMLPLQCVIVGDSGTCQQPLPLGSSVGDPCGPLNPVNQTCMSPLHCVIVGDSGTCQ